MYVEVTAQSQEHTSRVRIEHYHTNITRIELDGSVIFEQAGQTPETPENSADRSRMNLRTILEYADSVKIEDISEIIGRQIEYNTRISQEGLDNKWGACVGKTIIETWGDDVRRVHVPEQQQAVTQE